MSNSINHRIASINANHDIVVRALFVALNADMINMDEYVESLIAADAGYNAAHDAIVWTAE